MATSVLVINSGSSSIKYQLVRPESGESVASGLVERIGESESYLKHTYGEQVVEETAHFEDHAVGLARVLELFEQVGPDLSKAGIVAVGHRVVQGGRFFSGAAVVTDEVAKLVEELIPLAPLHNPANLTGIVTAQKLLPDVPHVVVFDTAFFQGLPEASARYALDRETAQKYSIRRYGAHGTSHKFVSKKVAELTGRDNLKQIVLHLGNGASVSAVDCGRAVDTSMGLTPLEGVVMGTRTGDIDPAAVFHLARNAGMSIDEIDTLFNKKSGMKGLCGENDMRQVWELADDGDNEAGIALDVYAHRLRKYIGAYAAVLGGLDVVTFTAGIGENDYRIRAKACEGLEFLGIEIDAQRNAHRGGPRVISTDDSRVTVYVVPTNEELEIARQAVAVI